jgi:2-methylisocitrate lyase-like PEP mutase family enzyme
MSQADRARALKALHVANDPLVLYNIWDAGGAIALAKAGAAAIATGSWSVAAAHGFEDGEAMPFDFALRIIERIARSTDLPLTVDFEGGYAETPEQVAANAHRVIQTGAVGLNFEDQVVGEEGLHDVAAQAARISAIRDAAREAGVPLFINARTDLFLQSEAKDHAGLVDAALARQAAYAEAGADGFFVPGLTDQTLIRDICARSSRPVNVLMRGELRAVRDVAGLGVSRISFGPAPYISALEDLTKRFIAI